jgi:hypothetical protein
MIGLAAVLLMTQLGDGELHLLDQQRAVLRFALERARPRFGQPAVQRASRVSSRARQQNRSEASPARPPLRFTRFNRSSWILDRLLRIVRFATAGGIKSVYPVGKW